MVESTAMVKAKDEEKADGRSFVDVSHIDRLGFDLISWDASERGPIIPVKRLIEVKGHGHSRLEFGLQGSEILAYDRNPAIYWMYTVDYCHTDNPRLQMMHARSAERREQLRITRRPRVLGRKKPVRMRMRKSGRSRIG
jgi:hypothetical protein